MSVARLHHESRELLSRIFQLHYPAVFSDSIGTLRSVGSNIPSWGNEPGIYYFAVDGSVVYVGRATPGVGLWRRVKNQINAYGDPDWDQIIKDPLVECGVYVFEKND